MNSNQSKIRVRGQRLIPSTFIQPTSIDNHQLSDCREKVESGNANKKRSKISLSDFLDRKLQKTCDTSNLVKGKDRPFLSPGTSISANRPIDGANADHQTKGPELDGLLGIVLEQFKPSKENEKDNFIDLEDEIQRNCVTQLTEESQTQDSSKRRNTFGGLYGKPPAPKRLVV
nr:hypothetical protein [Tanacetum cinerariifolium]